MNKSDKLRLYGQKDYTELIEFPVELVGKDGVVRRYTYEESLLVYAKRIESARQRYRDLDLADAEVDHCYKRIEQIKRSWKALAERRLEGAAGQAAQAEESAAAECRAFIREYFGKALAERVSTDEEPIPIYLSLMQQEGPRKVFHVSLAQRRGSYLLYAFDFGGYGADLADDSPAPRTDDEENGRLQYAQWARLLGMQPAGPDVERLLAAREGKEHGFLLTAAAGAPEPSIIPEAGAARGGPAAPGRGPRARSGARAKIQALLDEDPGNAEAHHALGALLLEENDAEGAVEALTTAVELQPWLRDAYLRLAAAAEAHGSDVEVEPYLLQARHYFPEDAAIHLRLAFVHARLDRLPEALAGAGRAVELDPASGEARGLLELLSRAKRSGSRSSALLAAAAGRPALRLRTRAGIAALAAALSIALLLRLVDPMASAFAVTAVLVLATLVRNARR